jgi:hypothetical protein
MKTPALMMFCLALAGCGVRKSTAGDGGPPDAGESDAPPLTSRRSFDVVATLRSASGRAFLVPEMIKFTLVLDPTGAFAIGGGGGQAKAVPLLTTDGRTFHLGPSFDVGVTQPSLCSTAQHIEFDALDVTVDGDHLTGSATGVVFEDVNEAPPSFEAKLAGERDTTPPFLVVPPGADTSDPLAPYELWTSEPLPASALARLVGGDGAVAGLVPEVIDTEIPIIASFARPTVTLPPGQTFEALFSDDVVDFAGNAAPLGDALRLASAPAAPLLAPDGFESATDATLSGAAILRDGPGIPIAGAASAYIGSASGPTPAGVSVTPKLVVRMSVPAGASKLTFSYRVLSLLSLPDAGSVQLGSVGRAPGPSTPLPTPTTFQMVTWGSQPATETPVEPMTVPLPDDIGPEIVVVIRAPAGCKAGFGLPGLLLDDLKID